MKKLHELFGIDLRSLALFRVCLGLILLWDLAGRLPDLRAFYTDAGALPRIALLSRMNPWALSIHLMSGTAAVQAALLGLQGVCAVGVLLGYRTRWMSVLSWFLMASLHRRNHMVAGGGDDYFRLLLFWSMFLPMGAQCSLDRILSPARRARPTSPLVFTWGTAAILLQIALGYLMAAYHKWDLPVWRDGTAIYYALNVDNYAKDFARFLLRFPPLLSLLTHAVFWLELLGALLLFCPVSTGLIRTVTVCGFLGMHAGFYLSMYLMLFPWVSAAAILVFLPSWFWDQLALRPWPPWAQFEQACRARLAPLPAGLAEVRPSKLANICAAACLFCVVSWNLEAMKPLRHRMPEPARALCQLAHLDQAWRMFAPPAPTGGWFVVPGTLKDGTEVDLFRRGASVSWAKPPQRLRFRNERWRRYMFNFVFGKNKAYWPDYARYLCRSWNAEHPGPRQLDSLEIVFMGRTTPPPGRTGAYEKKTLLRYACAGASVQGPGPSARILDASARAFLLAQASQSIQDGLHGDSAKRLPPSEHPALNAPAGVFVTLSLDNRLRGCRGSTSPSRTLQEQVVHFAREAAFNDPRFPPLPKEAFAALHVKISVLSPLRRVAGADQILPGIHGVMVRSGRHRGIFLPAVWKTFPDKATFLSALCAQKARLSDQCWNDSQTSLDVFTTTDFGL